MDKFPSRFAFAWIAVLAGCLIAAAMPRSSAAQADPLQGEWQRWVVPDARYMHAATFDPIHRRMYLFGGLNIIGVQLNDLWVLQLGDSPRWSRLQTQGPAPQPRGEHELAFDAAGDRLVLVGGHDEGSHLLRDIWVLDLSIEPLAWRFVVATGNPPDAVFGSPVVTDAAHGRLLFFGAIENQVRTRAVWVLSLDELMEWTRLPITGDSPGLRTNASAVMDSVNNRVLFFGGRDSLGVFRSDVWSLSLAGTPAWALVPVAGTTPPPRGECSAVYDPELQKLVVYGGRNFDTFLTDGWSLDLAGAPVWTEFARTGGWPSAQMDHAAIFDPQGQSMILFGGVENPTGFVRDETWSFSPDSGTWRRMDLPIPGPSARDHPGLVIDAESRRAFLFGGHDQLGDKDDLWSLSLDEPADWTRVLTPGAAPAPRLGNAFVLDPLRHRLLVSGGYVSGYPYSRELLALDLAPGGAWTDITPLGWPNGIFGHSLTYDPTRDRLMLFGGYDGATYPFSNSIYVLDLANPVAWESLTVSGPRPDGRIYPSTVFDVARDWLIVHWADGSEGGGDTWAFHVRTSTWTHLATEGPSMANTSSGAMTLDPARDRLCLLGWTERSHYLAAFWTLDLANPGAWVLAHPAGVAPAIRYNGVAAFDSSGDRLVTLMGTPGDASEGIFALRFTSPRLGVDPVQSAPRDRGLRIWPNPVQGEARMAIASPAARSVRVFDVRGRRVQELAASSGQWVWDLRDAHGVRVAPGLYFAVVRTAERTLRQRFVVLR